MSLDPWLLDNLICPRTGSPLELKGDSLYSKEGKRYPVIEDVPVMLLEDVEQTTDFMRGSIARAKGEEQDDRAPDFYLESLGISEDEKKLALSLSNKEDQKIDPVVSVLVAATNGSMYIPLIGKLDKYPLPEIPLPNGSGEMLLDIGCGWGRWSISAYKKGYTPVGMDPSLGAIMAAKRVARELGLNIRWVVGDARFLPFKAACFDTAYSYSVLQHFSISNGNDAVAQIGRVLKPAAPCWIQMPHRYGIRSLSVQFMRMFQKQNIFDVRYRSIKNIKDTFEKHVGKTDLSVDCFFGLGIRKTDYAFVAWYHKIIVLLSEILKSASRALPFLIYLSDSVFVKSVKKDRIM